MNTWASSSLTSPEQPKTLSDSRAPMIQEPVLRFHRAIDLIILRRLLEDSRQSRYAVRWSVGRTVEADVEPLDDRVSVLLSEGRVQAARDLASLIGGEWSALLAVPVVRRGPKAGDGETRFKSDRAWLDANRHNPAHRGKWVALRDGELVGADESLVVLHRALKEAGTLAGALFVRLV